jgi:hypothetical protein
MEKSGMSFVFQLQLDAFGHGAGIGVPCRQFMKFTRIDYQWRKSLAPSLGSPLRSAFS